MCVERTLPGAEHVVALAAQNAPNGSSTDAGPTRDGLERNTGLGQREDRVVGCAPPQPPLILQAFCGREELRIDGPATEGRADLLHGAAHGIKKRAAGVLHEMPTVGDLRGVRESARDRLAVDVGAIPRDRCDRRVSGQPCRGGGRLSIRQEPQRPTLLQIDDDRPIPAVSSEGEIVDPDDFRRDVTRDAAAANRANESVVAHRDRQSSCEPGSRPTA